MPTTDQLFAFLDGLRQDGYRIDGRQIAAAERLLLDAHTASQDSADARLKYKLAPLIAKSPGEQEDFYRRFDRWRGPVVLERPVVPPPRRRGAASDIAKRDPRRWIVGGVALVLLVLAAAIGYEAFERPPIPEPFVEYRPQDRGAPEPEPDTRAELLPEERFQIQEELLDPGYRVVKAALAAMPLLAFAAWLTLRWRRRLLWISRAPADRRAELGDVPLPVRVAEPLFTTPQFRNSAQELRKHRYLPTRTLNVSKTVDATCRRAGLFAPVYGERPQLPEYVFLIEQADTNDHLARLFELAVERLRKEGVFIERFYFHTDPRQLYGGDPEHGSIALSELAARTDGRILFVIGTADGFFHPMTGAVESWVERMGAWSPRALLSTKPLEQWSLTELRLLEEGFSLATAERSGFVAAGQKIAVGDESAELLEGKVVTPAPHGAVSRSVVTVPVRALDELTAPLAALRKKAAAIATEQGLDLASSLDALIEAISRDRPDAGQATAILDGIRKLMSGRDVRSLDAPRLFDAVESALAPASEAGPPLYGLRLFVNHAHVNQDQAELLAHALSEEGGDVRHAGGLATTVSSGSNWHAALDQALREADCMLLLWSFAVRKDFPEGRSEAITALREGKLLPVRIDDAPLTGKLAGIQAADLRGWAGERDDPRFRQLVGGIAQIARGSAAAAASEPADASLPDFAVFKDIEDPTDVAWCPALVALPAGEFMMGSPEGEAARSDYEGPRHHVTISHRVGIGRDPVTFEEYDYFCEQTNREKADDEGWGRGSRPVINVSWNDAQAYVDWLSEKTGEGYRLPTEAEWEYAARAGTETAYAFGETITPEQANFGMNVGKTTEAGRYPANAWGLRDMHGNVWEWVEDCWHGSYEGAPADGSAWVEKDCTYRVVRGGSWYNHPEILRSAIRVWFEPVLRYKYAGFRVARTLTP